MTEQDRKIIDILSKKLSEGEEDFLVSLHRHMNEAIKCRNLLILKRLKDLEWEYRCG